jgi:hypothetical protein
MTPKQKARVQAEAKLKGIPFSEMVNRMIDFYFDSKESPEKLEAAAELHIQQAIELKEKASLLKYGPPNDEDEEAAKAQIISFIEVLVKTCKECRHRHSLNDARVQDKVHRYLLKLSNDQLLLGRAEILFAQVWDAYFDHIEGKGGKDNATTNERNLAQGQARL